VSTKPAVLDIQFNTLDFTSFDVLQDNCGVSKDETLKKAIPELMAMVKDGLNWAFRSDESGMIIELELIEGFNYRLTIDSNVKD